MVAHPERFVSVIHLEARYGASGRPAHYPSSMEMIEGGFAPNGQGVAVARVGEDVNSIYVFLLLSPSVCTTGIVTSIVIERV